MKDSAILSSELLLLILASLWKPRQSICSRIRLTLAIVDLEMVSKELLGPADLSGAQALRIHKTMEVIVVHKNKNLVLITFYIVPPGLESFDNSQKLAIVGLIACICRNHFPRKKCYWVPLAQIGLSNYSIRTSSGS